MLIRCSAIHKIIGLPRSKNDRLTQTAKSHLIEQAKQELFGVAAFDGAKYTEKGNALEPFAIQGSGLIRGRQYAKTPSDAKTTASAANATSTTRSTA